LKWLRSTATSYAAFIHGAKSYVDSAFNDLDKVQAKHGKEVDDIVNNAYKELKAATKKGGMNVETASKTWEILEKTIKQLGELASDSASEILDNHPQLKEKIGGNLDQLKSMADNYGPEAKKELDDTYQQITDVVKGGVSMESINKVRQLIQEKTEQMKKFGDEAWKKGMEQAKPYLDKNPQVKEIVEKNQDSLKNGNFSELFEQVKDAVSSGSTDQLQQYVQQAGEKYSKMIPGSSGIFEKVQQLQEVAKNHGKEAEEIVKGAYEDIRKILEKRIGEAEKVASKAGQDAKK
jgi:ABC-type transporter Mla subunit MlaD